MCKIRFEGVERVHLKHTMPFEMKEISAFSDIPSALLLPTCLRYTIFLCNGLLYLNVQLFLLKEKKVIKPVIV